MTDPEEPVEEPVARPDPGPGAIDTGPEPTAGRPSWFPVSLAALGVVVAVAAVLSGNHPVGSSAADVIWTALFAVVVVVAGEHAARWSVVAAAVVAALVGVGGGPVAITCGLLALIGAGAVVWSGRRVPLAKGATAGLALLAFLYGPSFGFTGLPSLVAAAALVPVLVTAWPARPPWLTRAVLAVAAVVVVASGLAAGAALLARPHLTRAADLSQQALGTLNSGQVEVAAHEFGDASTAFRSSRRWLDSPLTWAGRFVPVVGQQVTAVRDVADVGQNLAVSAGTAASQADYRGLRTDNGTIDTARVQAMQGPVQASVDSIRHAQRVIQEVQSPWLVSPVRSKLDELARKLDDTAPTAETAAQALEVAPHLLGATSPQRYLLLFANPAESREAGGFIGTYGVITATNGKLHLEFTASTEEQNIPDGGQPRPFVPPPGWDERYGVYNVGLFPGNVSASPDLPTDAAVARQIFGQLPGVGAVDGVLYADPSALASLLSLTGPVPVQGLSTPLDADNVVEYLLYGQYQLFDYQTYDQQQAAIQQRRNVLGEVTSSVFDALTTRQLPSMQAMVDTLGPAVSGGHLRLVSFDDQARALFDRTGLSGAWSTPPGSDYVSLRSVNLAANKLDWFLQRLVGVDVRYDQRTGAVSSTITVTLKNDAPVQGLPAYVAGVDNPGQPRGTNHDALSLYTPLKLTGLTVDGAPAGVAEATAFGGNVYTVPLQIPPGGSRTLVFELTGSLRPGSPYRLDVLHQPLAHDDSLSVQLFDHTGTVATPLFDGPMAQNVEVAGIGTSNR